MAKGADRVRSAPLLFLRLYLFQHILPGAHAHLFCLDDITRQQLVTVQDNVYSITDKGRKVAQELAYDLPRSVRERAVAAVLRCQTWARKEAKYSASITEKPDGHCSVRCTVKGLDEALFCLDLGTPDRLSAELVKKQFILKGNEIYQLLVNKLTEENA